MASCSFCEIVAGDQPAHVVWADAAHVAFLDTNPARPGHLLLVPRVHVETIYDLAPEAFGALFERVRQLGPPLARAMGAERTVVAVEGYGVPHVHVHLVPVTGGGQLDPGRQQPADRASLAAHAASIGPALAGVPGTNGDHGNVTE